MAAMVSDGEAVKFLLSDECPVVFDLGQRNGRGLTAKVPISLSPSSLHTADKSPLLTHRMWPPTSAFTI
jgi:hypothetical protein